MKFGNATEMDEMEQESGADKEVRLDKETDAILNDAMRTERERVAALVASDKIKRDYETKQRKERNKLILWMVFVVPAAVALFVLIRSFQKH
jgi:hypothetical protein